MKDYHQKLIERNRKSTLPAVKKAIEDNTKLVFRFFVILCQMLIVQAIWIGISAINLHIGDSLFMIRLTDTFLLILMTSYALMNFGFSKMVKHAYDAQRVQERKQTLIRARGESFK